MAGCLVAIAVAAGACGPTGELPPAAEPARSPPVAAEPAGRVVPVGRKPEGLAADPLTGTVAVGLTNPDLLALVDGRTGRVTRRVRIEESPRHLALAGPGGPVLVPAERANSLISISLSDGDTAVTRVGEFPHDATAAAGRIFVGDEYASTVSVIEDGRLIRTLETTKQPGGLASAGDRVAVVGVKERTLELIDARTLETIDEVAVGIGPTHVVSDGGNRLLVADTDGGAVLVLRMKPELAIVRRIALPGKPYGIAADSSRQRFWVTLTETNEVVELSGRTVTRRFPSVRQPNSVAVDTRRQRVYVASRTDGTLQIIETGE